MYRKAYRSKGYKLVSKKDNLSDTAKGQYKGQYSLLGHKALSNTLQQLPKGVLAKRMHSHNSVHMRFPIIS